MKNYLCNGATKATSLLTTTDTFIAFLLCQSEQAYGRMILADTTGLTILPKGPTSLKL